MTRGQEAALVEAVRACLTTVRATSLGAEGRWHDRFETAFPPGWQGAEPGQWLRAAVEALAERGLPRGEGALQPRPEGWQGWQQFYEAEDERLRQWAREALSLDAEGG